MTECESGHSFEFRHIRWSCVLPVVILIRETEMKHLALTTCLLAALQALTGCCCCDMGQVSPCYSSCGPVATGYVGGGCCGDDLNYALPPSPYAVYPQQNVRIRGRGQAVAPVYSPAYAPTYAPGYEGYSADPYIQGATPPVDNGSMYESFGADAMQGEIIQGPTIQGPTIQQNGPGGTGWQAAPNGTLPTPAPVPDSGPTTFSAPMPIPQIGTTPSAVPGPPTTGQPRTTHSIPGPNMGPMPPAIPDNVSQMGYRRQLPVQRAF